MKMKQIISILSIFVFLVMLLCGCNDKEDEINRLVQEYRESKLSVYEKENAMYDDYEVDVAFLGDSLTDGYDLKKHYPDFLVVNRGIGGDTTFGLEERIDVSLYDLKPKIAVMLIGANNMDTMFENYEELLKGFKENVPNTKIVLLSLTSMSGEWGRKNQLASYNNVKIKLLAEEYGFEYIDLYSALFNIEAGEIYAEYTTDGGHLTELGYEVLTQQITPVIEKLLN